MPDKPVTLSPHEVQTMRREIAELIGALERIDTRLKHAEQEARNGVHRRQT